MQRTRRRSLALPLLLACALLPRLVIPAGAVVCIESCGELEVTAAHASRACHHGESSGGHSEGEHESADHDHATSHDPCHSDDDAHGDCTPGTCEASATACLASDEACLDFVPSDDRVLARAERADWAPLTPLIAPESVTVEIDAPLHSLRALRTRHRPPPDELGARLIPLRV